LPEIENVGINVVRFSTQKNDGLGNKIFIVLDHSKIENAVDFLFRNTRNSLSEYVFKKANVNEIEFKDLPLGWFADVLNSLKFLSKGGEVIMHDCLPPNRTGATYVNSFIEA
jgi:hypothetical protein